MKYPVGIQNFGEIIRGGYVYVDKTALIWQLIDRGKYYFLSRPRRFGKSLLLSTIAAWFQGKKKLFEGLAIANLAGECPEEHPVLHLDLSNQTCTDVQIFNMVLNNQLNVWEEQYGKRDDEPLPSLRFGGIIQRAYNKTQKKVVILIDEYDKPLLDVLDNEKLREAYRIVLHDMYSNLKKYDRYIEFAILTGITRFSKLSIFSGLNNLNDISMIPEYATLCGITEQELETYFVQGIEELAQYAKISVDEARGQLKRCYDGYLFEEHAESVYNPFSLLSTLNNKKFKDYWYETGTPTFLAEILARENFDLENLPNESVEASDLDALDSLNSNPLPILYQSGYLTIDHCDDLGYYLRFPNEEVERSFLKQLLPLQVAKGQPPANSLLVRMIGCIRQGQPEDFMGELQTLLADIPYEQGKPGEIYFRNLLFTIFRLIGFYCEVEHPVAGGRSDVVIKTKDFIYVLELKVDQSAEAALQQIEKKGYAAPYAADPRKLFKLGVNFSTKTKQVDEWRIVER
ncbi:MAG: AAA family ATPase [Deltaproteobacteria bacterium]|nr:AAA family ATPase [Deltaproteobacteria bacterium]